MRNFLIGIARLLAGSYIKELERAAEEKTRENEAIVNQRVASITAKIDPVDLLVRQYNGIFSQEFERPEDRLDEPSIIRLEMWAYQQREDPSFNFLVEWIMNSAGNETVKRAPITVERSQYGRAQIANMVLWKREIARLASNHQDRLDRKKEEFISTSVVE